MNHNKNIGEVSPTNQWISKGVILERNKLMHTSNRESIYRGSHLKKLVVDQGNRD